MINRHLAASGEHIHKFEDLPQSDTEIQTVIDSNYTKKLHQPPVLHRHHDCLNICSEDAT